jgi:hypothetical protein
MRFTVEQLIAAPAGAVLEAYLEPALYDTFAGLPKLGDVEGRAAGGEGNEVVVEAWYRFTAPLPPGAGRIVDAHKLTWLEVTRYRPADLTGHFELRPDHYPRLLSCRGDLSVEADGPDRCVRRVQGDLRLHLPFWARALTGRAEHAIVSGLREALVAQVPRVERFVDDRAR